MPRFSKPPSPPLPPSPSNEAVKRRKILNQNRQTTQTQPAAQEQDQEMAVDDESTNAGTAHPVVPTMRDNGGNEQSGETGHTADRSEDVTQEEDIFVEVDEKENAKTLARIMNTDDPLTEKDNSPDSHPLEKFTNSPMPRIFDEDPATLLAGLERNQLQAWLDLPTGKVLARPFDIEVRYKPNHNNIANKLRTAVKEITGATRVTVALPKRDPNLPKDGTLKFPTTFLIHDVSKKDVETLLERTVWSSKEITFQVSSIYVKRPDFLFTIERMTTDNPVHVLACIGETWNDTMTNNFVHKLVSAAPSKEDQQNRLNEIIEFLESASVRLLDVRSEGGQENPHYNVYADGEAIQNNKTWLELRKFLRNRLYKSNYHGDGKAKSFNFVCSLCHGNDHPRGLCAFPHVPGWNGGGRNPIRPNIPDQQNVTDQRNHPYNPSSGTPRARGNNRGKPLNRGRGRGIGRSTDQYSPR